MYAKPMLSAGAVLVVSWLAFSPSYAQDKTAPTASPQADQSKNMPPEMMARMNKMMDQCEKMMGNSDMRKGMMRRHKRS